MEVGLVYKLKENTVYQHIQEKLLELDSISNPPFNPRKIQEYLKDTINKLGFTLVSNPYYSYVHVAPKPSAPKLILFCHTDHPAFIFKNCNSGILFGKFNLDQVTKKLPFEIDVYNKEGEKVFKEFVVSMVGREFKTSGKIAAKPNYSARFSIEDERVVGDKLRMYSADNYVGTYALLHLLATKRDLNSEFDLYIVFNHYEEVFQLGSMKFSMDNLLGINRNDIIINIDTWKEGSGNKLLLQTLEKGCVYSLWSNEDNQAEYLAKTSAQKSSINFDIGVDTGSGDGRVFDHYKLTPNLISIGIPRDRYHNFSIEGEIGYEVVSLSTLKQLLKWLKEICFAKNDKADKQEKLIDRKTLKKYHDTEWLDKAIESNIIAFNNYIDAVERGYFFHEKISEKFAYWFKKFLKSNK